MLSGEYKGFKYCFGRGICRQGCICVSPDLVFGPRHVESSIITAIDAYLNGSSVARDLYVEILVRITGKRQIKEALKARVDGDGVVVCVSRNSVNCEGLSSLESKPGELDAIERRLLLHV